MGLRTIMNASATLLLATGSHDGSHRKSRGSTDAVSLLEDNDRKSAPGSGGRRDESRTSRAYNHQIKNRDLAPHCLPPD